MSGLPVDEPGMDGEAIIHASLETVAGSTIH